MSPSQLSWTQGFLFFFLSLVVPGIWYCARKWWTRQGTSDVELSSIQIGNDTGTSPLDACGGDDEGGRSPSSQATVVFKALPSQRATFRPDRRRLRRSQRSTVKRPKREQANIAADSTSTPAWMFSTPPVLQQQPPGLVPGPSPHLEETIPQMDETILQLEETIPQMEETIPQLEDQAKTFEGLRHRPNTPTPRKAREPNWTVQEKDALLELKRETETFAKGKKQYDFISEALLDRYGFDRSPNSCSFMWDTFLNRFKAIRVTALTSFELHKLPLKSMSLKQYYMMERIMAGRR